MTCSYCYLGRSENKIQDIPFSLKEIQRAFSKKRLGGVSFINICSDGETFIHPMMPDIIKTFLDEGHYVMCVTNGTMTEKIKDVLRIKQESLSRLFFKLSFHYEELCKMKLLERFFDNVKLLLESPCSISVEYITTDETLWHIDEFKEACLNGMGVLPQINMPRDERKYNLGLLSKYSWHRYLEIVHNAKISSEFFDFRKQYFGKKYTGFCYNGHRHMWVNMKTGYSQQCYGVPTMQNFMKDALIRWIPIGNHCQVAHCYVCYTFFTLGTTEAPSYGEYRPTYIDIRNRKDSYGREWIKPTYQKVFACGVERWEFSKFEKRIANLYNRWLRWYRREYGI